MLLELSTVNTQWCQFPSLMSVVPWKLVFISPKLKTPDKYSALSQKSPKEIKQWFDTDVFTQAETVNAPELGIGLEENDILLLLPLNTAAAPNLPEALKVTLLFPPL